MNKKMRAALSGTIISAVLFAGCTALNKVPEAETNSQAADKSAVNLAVGNKEEDKQIKKLISDYFVKLYSVSVDSYQKNSETGKIPDNLRSFVSERTIKEGNNNTEIGLNFPRFIGLNGYTLISYSPVLMEEDKKQPKIEAAFIEDNGGTMLYFIKLDLKANCIADSVFDTNYTLNPQTNTYQKNAEVSGDIIDNILIQARYDVELVKEGDSYRIMRARESTYKQGTRNRLFRYNNDFVTRLPYLYLDKTDDKKEYVNKEDGALYSKEKTIISAFFDNIINLDNERRTLISGSWNKSFSGFNDLMKSIGVTKDKDKKEILVIDSTYKEKLPKEALMLQNDIYRIKTQGDFKDVCNIILHPAYSQKNKWYIVTFNAAIEKVNGVMGNQQDYTFDYLIKLTEKADGLRVDSVKLNGISPVIKEEEKAAETIKN